jgi:hypothetical protein
MTKRGRAGRSPSWWRQDGVKMVRLGRFLRRALTGATRLASVAIRIRLGSVVG